MSRTSSTSHGSIKRKRRHPTRRFFLALLLVCVAIVGVRAGVRYARGTIRDELHRRIEEFVESAGGSVELGEVRLEESNKVCVSNVLVSFHEEGAGPRTFASIREVEVKANLLSALLRRSFPMTVTLFNPQINLERRADGTLKLPFVKGALSRDDFYSLIVHVRSGRLHLKQEGRSDTICAEDIILTLRSRADRRAFRIESTFSLPSVSDKPLRVNGWIHPAESRFDVRQKGTGLNVAAVTKLITDTSLNVQGGVMDCTLDMRGVIGESIAVQGPVAFTALQVDDAPPFLREIDGTAEVSFTVDYETNEVSVEESAIESGLWQGLVSGRLAFGDGEPTGHLRGQFDSFPANELVRFMVDERFPEVSETRIALDQEASLGIEIDGKMTEPQVDLVVSCSASRATFKIETDRYETADASVELAETMCRWNPAEGVSLDTAVSNGTLQGGRMPFVIKELGGRISFRNGSAGTDSLTMLVDDLPIAVSGHADVSGSGIPAAQATIRCAIDDLAGTRYASPLKDLNLSGPAALTAGLHKLDESVRWDVDADLTDADVQWRGVFHKPAGISARLRLSDAVPAQNVTFKASLGQSNAAGSATMGGGEAPAITALILESESFRLAELAPLFNLPVEVREEAGTKLAFAVNAENGRPRISAGLSAERLAVTLLDEGSTEPVQIEFEDFATTLKTDTNGYQTDLTCATVKLSPTIHTLAKGGYRPEYPARLTSPVRIVASIDRFEAVPCEMNQLECEILLSGSQWVLSEATGGVANGTFELHGSMTHDEGTFSFEYGCDGLEISEIMCWMPDGAEGISGDLSAQMSLSGRLGTAGSRSGQGTFTVTDGEIDSSHVASRTQGLENGSEPSPIQFDTLRCDFSLDNDTINVSNLLVEKPGLLVQGRGTITLDGQVDQTFDVEISRSVAEQLSTKKRWGLLDELVGSVGQVLPLPRLTEDPIKRTFTVKGTVDSLETEVERGPLYVELVRATFAFSESVVVSGVTVLALPARMFTDVLSWANGL